MIIFRGDIHVNGNGRDTYKFRAIHPNNKKIGNLRKLFTIFNMMTENLKKGIAITIRG